MGEPFWSDNGYENFANLIAYNKKLADALCFFDVQFIATFIEDASSRVLACLICKERSSSRKSWPTCNFSPQYGA